MLVNNGPASAHFSIFLKPRKNDDRSESEDSQMEFDENEQGITIEPEEGRLPPYGFAMNFSFFVHFAHFFAVKCLKITKKLSKKHKNKTQNSKQLVEITYHPDINPQSKGFLTEFIEKNEFKKLSASLTIESNDVRSSIEIPVMGEVMLVNVNCIPNTLYFGDCNVHDRRDAYIEITNKV